MSPRALLSVSDKTNLTSFAQALNELGWELVSTSGTAKAIKNFGLPCTLVEEITGFPEMLNGRVRTLHPKIFAGIIADQRDPAHMDTLDKYSIEPFQLVIVNLYNFEGAPSIEQIDVGGPSMVRAAAKNFHSVIVVVDPADYKEVILSLVDAETSPSGELMSLARRQELAKKAFEMSANYERLIADHLKKCVDEGTILADGKKH